MRETAFDDLVPNINYQVFRKCGPDWRLRPWRVKDFDLTYIIKGSARYTLDGIDYELEAGDILFLSKGVEKEAFTYAKKPMSCFAVNFSPLSPPAKPFKPLFPMISRIGLRQDIIGLFKDLTICWAEQQNGYTLKCRALLMLILHRLSEIVLFNIDSAPGDYRVKKISSYISIHFAEKLTVKTLAAMVNLDATYFGYLFRQETGMTVRQYIMQIRIRNAENMLQSGNFMVKEAAEQCGFCDVIHFYKQFRLLRGFPPSRCIPKDTPLPQFHPL
jgi:AraC-like DNA-binding protein